jgi:hypothetical protein
VAAAGEESQILSYLITPAKVRALPVDAIASESRVRREDQWTAGGMKTVPTTAGILRAAATRENYKMTGFVLA